MTMASAGGERRVAPRRRRADLPEDLCGRVKPGHAVRVIDLSARGALLESSRRLLPGSRVEVHLECGDFRHVTRATVVRCSVGMLLPQAVVFRAAIEFDRQLERWRAAPAPLTVELLARPLDVVQVEGHDRDWQGRIVTHTGR